VSGAVGVPPEEIVLVRPGTLPKTSSGKLQRSLCRQRYLGADLELA
jgi:fatty-acyl-CoA synthase